MPNPHPSHSAARDHTRRPAATFRAITSTVPPDRMNLEQLEETARFLGQLFQSSRVLQTLIDLEANYSLRLQNLATFVQLVRRSSPEINVNALRDRMTRLSGERRLISISIAALDSEGLPMQKHLWHDLALLGQQVIRLRRERNRRATGHGTRGASVSVSISGTLANVLNNFGRQ